MFNYPPRQEAFYALQMETRKRRKRKWEREHFALYTLCNKAFFGKSFEFIIFISIFLLFLISSVILALE